MPELVYGRHAVSHILKAGRRRATRLFLQKDIEEEKAILDLAQKGRIAVQRVESSFFHSRFGASATHQGIAAEVEGYPYVPIEDLFLKSTLLILDEIQDPQNLGALCRSAYLFGVDGVVIPETHAASIGAGACQASVGAVEYLQIARISSIAKVLENLKKNGFWIYGTDASADKNVYEENYPEKVALVIGNEEKGMRKLVRETCDILIRIPVAAGAVDSLNASVAGGVALYEIFRQRMQKRPRT